MSSLVSRESIEGSCAGDETVSGSDAETAGVEIWAVRQRHELVCGSAHPT